MTTTYKKKLIEVAIPLEAINEASIKEKSSPFLKGHPRALHQWWARRPLVACRGILFAQLVDDPSSNPAKFPTQHEQELERLRLFEIMRKLVQWDSGSNDAVLSLALAEIRKSCGDVLPTVHDPFSGGASIPLEAHRLGLKAVGSDINPVAVMIGKATIEFPVRFYNFPPVHGEAKERTHYDYADGLAEDIRFYSKKLAARAKQKIGPFYPDVSLPRELGGGKAKVAAWIWCRTVPSPDPAFGGTHVPISTSFVVSSKAGKEAWIKPIIDKVSRSISFQIMNGKGAGFEEAKAGTKASRGANFTCLLSNSPITSEYVKDCARRGDMSHMLLCIVADGRGGKIFVAPSPEHETVERSVPPQKGSTINLPQHPQYVGVGGYGFKTFGSLFSPRQLMAISALSAELETSYREVYADAQGCLDTLDDRGITEGGRGPKAYAQAVITYLAFGIDKLADYGSTLCGWNPINQNARQLFSRQAISMTWDFLEANPFGSMISFERLCTSVAGALDGVRGRQDGLCLQSDAANPETALKNMVISTDPPYYDNVPYADISDFFYGIMKQNLGNHFPDVFKTVAVPKLDELVADRVRHGSAENAESFFLSGMIKALQHMASSASNEFPVTIYYAFKQSEVSVEGTTSTGWATFLEAVVSAGYSVVSTWPVRTEREARTRAIGSNALANSVVLVCRIREGAANVITRAEFIRALKRELPSAIKELQSASIAPADMPQSAIGPGMGVFSRYRAVLESDDSPMSVKAALQLINRELSEYLDGVVGEFDADTGFAIKWFELNGLKSGDYGTANMIAQAKGIAVESVKHAGIVESQAGKVRILGRDELQQDWEPGTDSHLTVWECCQHLVRLHEKFGLGYETAVLLKKIGSKADDVRDLAYVLYSICEKRGEAKEATSYNALIADWTDLTREAAAAPLSNRSGQMKLDV
jgi:putative DNA methylase